jgi:hypothetical protein
LRERLRLLRPILTLGKLHPLQVKPAKKRRSLPRLSSRIRPQRPHLHPMTLKKMTSHLALVLP